jgi:hypothetical protein
VIRNHDVPGPRKHESTKTHEVFLVQDFFVSFRGFVVPAAARAFVVAAGYATPMADDLDETIEASFPASDAPGNTPETGIGVNGDHEAAPESHDDTGGTPEDTTSN